MALLKKNVFSARRKVQPQQPAQNPQDMGPIMSAEPVRDPMGTRSKVLDLALHGDPMYSDLQRFKRDNELPNENLDAQAVALLKDGRKTYGTLAAKIGQHPSDPNPKVNVWRSHGTDVPQKYALGSALPGGQAQSDVFNRFRQLPEAAEMFSSLQTVQHNGRTMMVPGKEGAATAKETVQAYENVRGFVGSGHPGSVDAKANELASAVLDVYEKHDLKPSIEVQDLVREFSGTNIADYNSHGRRMDIAQQRIEALQDNPEPSKMADDRRKESQAASDKLQAKLASLDTTYANADLQISRPNTSGPSY